MPKIVIVTTLCWLYFSAVSPAGDSQTPARAQAKPLDSKPPAPARAPVTGQRPAAAGISPQPAISAQQDKEIEAAIRAKLDKSKIGKDGFTVRVQGGVAYWEGSTEVVQHKGSATRMAKTAGAHRVINNIKIADSAREKAGANLEQGRRRVQVKRGEPR